MEDKDPPLGTVMESEMVSQPLVLGEQVGRFFDAFSSILEGRDFDMVLLAARGSSDHAALYARYLIEVHLGIPVSLAAPSVLTRYGSKVRYRNCLAIGISQSGAAPDVSEMLVALREAGHLTVGITNTEGSRISESAEHTLFLGVGPELAVAATKTYTASLLALYQMVRVMGASLPAPTVFGEDWVSVCRSSALGAVDSLLAGGPVFALARGYRFASACEAALKLIECALMPCKAYSTADFQHGPKALALEGSAAICFGATDVLDGLKTAAVFSPEAEIVEEQQPIWDMVFGQWLALELARRRGIDPDTVPNLRKVTKTR